MEKSKLGVSVGVLSAFVFIATYISGYFVTVILVGYILLKEENEWLRKNAIRSIAIAVVFSLLYTIIGLVPDFFVWLEDIYELFDDSINYSKITTVVSLIKNTIRIMETVVFLTLGLHAIKGKDVEIPVIDKKIKKYI